MIYNEGIKKIIGKIYRSFLVIVRDIFSSS